MYTGCQPEGRRDFLGTKLFQELGTNLKKKDQNSKKRNKTQEKRNKTQEKMNKTQEKRYKTHDKGTNLKKEGTTLRLMGVGAVRVAPPLVVAPDAHTPPYF